MGKWWKGSCSLPWWHVFSMSILLKSMWSRQKIEDRKDQVFVQLYFYQQQIHLMGEGSLHREFQSRIVSRINSTKCIIFRINRMVDFVFSAFFRLHFGCFFGCFDTFSIFPGYHDIWCVRGVPGYRDTDAIMILNSRAIVQIKSCV